MVVFKFFTVGDYEKLEHWINKMCFKGYALKDYSFGRFYFEPCMENEYYYSIELFENLPSSLSSEDFFNCSYLKKLDIFTIIIIIAIKSNKNEKTLSDKYSGG